MPRRKRTRTTSTDRRGKGGRNSGDASVYPSRTAHRATQGKLNPARRDVAAEAARIMATEGQRNYMAAKRKAAERIGYNHRLSLPSNKEVEQALRAYQGVFGGERHSRDLQRLRETAVEVMRRLERFCPRLVGPVLDGTADGHSRVSLQLFHDPPEEVLFSLEEMGVPFHEEQRKIRWHDGGHRSIQLLVTQVGSTPVELALFGSLDLRQAPPCPIHGRPQKRARLFEVESLLAA
jgi:hypothetical protein